MSIRLTRRPWMHELWPHHGRLVSRILMVPVHRARRPPRRLSLRGISDGRWREGARAARTCGARQRLLLHAALHSRRQRRSATAEAEKFHAGRRIAPGRHVRRSRGWMAIFNFILERNVLLPRRDATAPAQATRGARPAARAAAQRNSRTRRSHTAQYMKKDTRCPIKHPSPLFAPHHNHAAPPPSLAGRSCELHEQCDAQHAGDHHRAGHGTCLHDLPRGTGRSAGCRSGKAADAAAGLRRR